MAELIRGVPFDYEPKRENRFFVEFPTELGIEVWKVQEFKRPSMTINSVEIPFINETNYVIGKYKWETIDIKFIDTIGPSTSTQIMEWVRLHAESLTGREGYAAGYKKNLILKALDPTGVEIEKWFLEQCMITSVDFGNNSMDSDALQMVSVTIQPYRCILNY
ncbi:MAG: hypothetical protein HC836_35855 [Richelia sp. RM2_1_2]|nr:hypothetical protein [Richelia sp. RM2_1_2]